MNVRTSLLLLLLAVGCGHLQTARRPNVSGQNGEENPLCNGHDSMRLPNVVRDPAFTLQGIRVFRCYD